MRNLRGNSATAGEATAAPFHFAACSVRAVSDSTFACGLTNGQTGTAGGLRRVQFIFPGKIHLRVALLLGAEPWQRERRVSCGGARLQAGFC